MAGKQDLQELLDRFLQGQCSPQEIQLLLDHFNLNGDTSPLRERVEEQLAILPPQQWEESKEVRDVFDRVNLKLTERITADKNPVLPFRPTWYRYVGVAASVLVVLGLGLYFFKAGFFAANKVAQTPITNDALPGSNKATLTLADGSVLDLDSATKGEIARQTGVVINKTSDGQLIYETSKVATQNPVVAYNTISTPNGGQYHVILPDGTRIWLNAASSLRYPTSFSGSERRVSLSGEGYFEVAKDRTKPFIVTSDKQEVEVLGTHFNINAYANEAAVNTTLLEGSVRVIPTSKALHPEIVKPGQQAILSQHIKLISVDIEQAVAWKNGMFDFQDTNLKEVMRQLERWYDVEVDYTGMPDVEFVGVVPRNAKLSSVLKALELTSNVKFKIEERRIRLMK